MPVAQVWQRVPPEVRPLGFSTCSSTVDSKISVNITPHQMYPMVKDDVFRHICITIANNKTDNKKIVFLQMHMVIGGILPFFILTVCLFVPHTFLNPCQNFQLPSNNS